MYPELFCPSKLLYSIYTSWDVQCNISPNYMQSILTTESIQFKPTKGTFAFWREQDILYCLFVKKTGGSFPVGFYRGLGDKMGWTGFPGVHRWNWSNNGLSMLHLLSVTDRFIHLQFFSNKIVQWINYI
jgi:hypothetical protein